MFGLITFSGNIYSQDNIESLKTNSIKIDNLNKPDKKVYDVLSNYRVIMIGEIHGTNEPVNMLRGLVDLFTQNGDSVLVDFEIPETQMTTYLYQHTDKSILNSEFFSRPSGDGRASIAWYTSLAKISKNKKAKIFFFDKAVDQIGNSDSIMFSNIKSNILEHPNWKTIVICGDVHSSTMPYEEQMTTGSLLINDQDLNLADSLCSLNHVFESGETLWNEFPFMPTTYSQLAYDYYLFVCPKGRKDPYQAIFFTRKLTKSESAVSK